jgi:hypothetical protein
MSNVKVQKTTFKIVVLHLEDDGPGENVDLESISHEMCDGAWVGQLIHEETVDVPPDQVEHELTEVGNDGSFFGDGEDPE